MSNINVGVLLKLSDQFSPNMNKALSATKNFATGFNGAMNKVDGVLNSMSGKVAMLGLSIGATATINNMIKFEDRLNKIKTIALSTASDTAECEKQMAGLGDEIYRVANLPHIKVDAKELLSTFEEIMEKTGSATFALENLENLGSMMSAFQIDGNTAGSMLSEFQKLGYDAEKVKKVIDSLYVQGNKGAFTAKSFAEYGSQIIAAYSAVGSDVSDITNVGGVMQILKMIYGRDAESVTGLKAIMFDLGNEDKAKKLKNYGLSIYDTNGKMRDLNDIMLDIVKVQKGLNGEELNKFNGIFGDTAKLGIAGLAKYAEKLPDLLDLSDSLDATTDAGKKNAKSFAANLRNLQTAFDRFAYLNLSPALTKATEMLNKFAENPERFQKVFKTIAAGLGVVFAVKTVSTINSVASSLQSMFGFGGKNIQTPNLNGGLGGAGTAGAIPVFVTNFGSMTGVDALNPNGMNIPNPAGMNTAKQAGATALLSKGALTKLGIVGAIFGGIASIPQAVSEWQAANKDTSLSDKEKSKRKGGAVGNVVGTVAGGAGGMMAGAMAGAAIGSVVPGLGNIAGLIIGGSIGMLGGKIGREIGGEIGETLIDNSIANELQNTPKVEMLQSEAIVKGNAEIGIKVEVTDDRVNVKTKENKNDINNTKFELGSISQYFAGRDF